MIKNFYGPFLVGRRKTQLCILQILAKFCYLVMTQPQVSTCLLFILHSKKGNGKEDEKLGK